jgi:hypothetical protein
MARGAAILKLPNRIAAHGPEATPSQTGQQVIRVPPCFSSPPLLRGHAYGRDFAANAYDELFKDA